MENQDDLKKKLHSAEFFLVIYCGTLHSENLYSAAYFTFLDTLGALFKDPLYIYCTTSLLLIGKKD